VLAEALARLPNAWRWIVIGDGPFRGRLERLVGHLGIAPRVSFLGRASDRELHAWYEAATLFVHPTLYEGSSLVTLEAMAHRRAVLASRAGGLPDKVQPGITGWLVEPGDPGALASALGEALLDPERLGAMGYEGRRLVEREFSWPTVTTRLLNVYNEVLQESNRWRPDNSG
jgi:glycogen synthase